MLSSKRLFVVLSLFTIVNASALVYNVRLADSANNENVGIFVSSDVSELGENSSANTSYVVDQIAKNEDDSSLVSFSEQDVRRIVREEIEANPKFVLDALNRYMQQQQVAEAKNADDKILQFADKITESKGYAYVGNPDGKVEVSYYFDINCGFCKKIHSELNRFIADNPDVKLVHREMPILTETSRTAASIAGVLFHLYPEGYETFHEILSSNPAASNADDVEQALREAVGEEKAREVISKSFDLTAPGLALDTSTRIKATLDTASEAGITGTPFLFVKGTDVFVRGAVPDLYDQLSRAAETIRNQ